MGCALGQPCVSEDAWTAVGDAVMTEGLGVVALAVHAWALLAVAAGWALLSFGQAWLAWPTYHATRPHPGPKR